MCSSDLPAELVGVGCARVAAARRPSATGAPRGAGATGSSPGSAAACAGRPCPCASSPCTITGLTNGTPYSFTVVGSIKYLFFGNHKHAPMHEVLLPVIGFVILAYTIYRNVWPIAPEGPPRGYFITTVAVFGAVTVFVLAAPNFARKMGERLNADENLVEINE